MSDISGYFPPGKAHVWVEDELTQQYLAEIWPDTALLFHVSRGNAPLRALAHDAAVEGLPNVVAIADRDWGRSNFDQWLNPASDARILTLPVYEIENYLLDPVALAGCDLHKVEPRRSVQEIEDKLRQAREGQLWAVCGAGVIAKWRGELFRDFPQYPTIDDAPNEAAAINYLRGRPWFAQLAGRSTTITAPQEPAASLEATHRDAQAWMAANDWLRRFPGKELFRAVRGFINPGRAGVPADIDVAKSVARWQFATGHIPVDLTQLRAAIRQRTGH